MVKKQEPKVADPEKDWSNEPDEEYPLPIPARIVYQAGLEAAEGIIGTTEEEVLLYWLRRGCLETMHLMEEG